MSSQDYEALWARFDTPIDRRGTASTKWDKYQAQPGVLPFWVADMDLPTPDFVLDAVRERLEHPVLGYTNVPATLIESFCGWLARRYEWQVDPEWLVWISGVVPGLEVAARAVGTPGTPLFIPCPVYYPFLKVARHSGRREVRTPLHRVRGADIDRWEMDFEAMRTLVRTHPTATARALLLCNPQNPTGRRYRRDELARLADLAIEENLVVISDDIHCELLLDDGPHTPLASLNDAIAARTISLFAPGKTYNLPGLSSAVAVIPDAQLRARFQAARAGMVGSPGPLAYAAAEAAYGADDHWLEGLRAYLRRNRDAVAAVVGDRAAPVEATYLTWIDVSDLGLNQPASFFEDHGLGLNDGSAFGGAGFVRFNFGCSSGQLETGLERLRTALAEAPPRE
ncbi:MAG: PatB family C-S lyase [Pseudomonadota bacterium]